MPSTGKRCSPRGACVPAVTKGSLRLTAIEGPLDPQTLRNVPSATARRGQPTATRWPTSDAALHRPPPPRPLQPPSPTLPAAADGFAFDGTSMRPCSTTTTKSTTICPVQTTARRRRAALVLPTEVLKAKCADDMWCAKKPGHCKVLNNKLDTSGVVVAIISRGPIVVAALGMCVLLLARQQAAEGHPGAGRGRGAGGQGAGEEARGGRRGHGRGAERR
ncbi:predicted protein [Verticillium alfalfae VaMs.102]|uniref:Predicted protein n=1 Tax=Verticillium alfalfae (strain VaMs.102 / ATCC MYA-4576 / FGSC 10136) TaxID=526221 RepID=C9SMZ5_VERA1|nr:predicted protein [Verticillium alfalfae VaMs.102]EEY20160.1 predicted protein [Verticillium alfalfae VaMs.102]